MIDVKILLVEDNEGDIILTQEALFDARINNKVSIVRDGEEAINYLTNALHIKLLPDLILLDINLPKIDGKEVLFYIKNDPSLKNIPVVMLTTSSSEMDITEAYNNQASGFIIKPVDLQKFFNVINTIENFSVTIVKQPVKD